MAAQLTIRLPGRAALHGVAEARQTGSIVSSVVIASAEQLTLTAPGTSSEGDDGTDAQTLHWCRGGFWRGCV